MAVQAGVAVGDQQIEGALERFGRDRGPVVGDDQTGVGAGPDAQIRGAARVDALDADPDRDPARHAVGVGVGRVERHGEDRLLQFGGVGGNVDRALGQVDVDGDAPRGRRAQQLARALDRGTQVDGVALALGGAGELHDLGDHVGAAVGRRHDALEMRARRRAGTELGQG